MYYLKNQAVEHINPGIADLSFFSNPRYIAFHSLMSWATWMESATQVFYYMTLIQDACKKAGFNSVRYSTIAADGNQLITDAEMIIRLNRALIHTDPSYGNEQPRRIIKKDHQIFINQAFWNGAPVKFIQPAVNTFNMARLPYLVAE
jgi:hypothetical protein